MSREIPAPGNAVAVVSGGMDSITMLYFLHSEGYKTHVLSFDYGQKHKKELEFARWHADHLKMPHHIIDLSSVSTLLDNSSLVNEDKDVPEGHYADESMKSTVVPNRNMMMISIAAAAAVNDGAHIIGVGVHGGDHPVYPDCRPQFITDVTMAIKSGNVGFADLNLHVWAPFIHTDKTMIARKAADLNVDLRKTWSCYKGGDKHCGKCGTCVERKEAIHDAGLVDPTEYEES